MEKFDDIKVSVAMATYNGQQYLEEQLESLFRQTFKPNEIIVCDDHSTDGTRKILQKYANEGLIKVFFNEEKIGVLENFKKAVSLCAEQNYIALSDQDDVWDEKKIEIEVKALQAIDLKKIPSLVYTDLKLVSREMELIDSSFMDRINIIPEKENLKSLLFGNFLTGCTMMFNPSMRKHFLRIPSNAFMHDVWLGLVAFTIGRSCYIPIALVNYRRHGYNVTSEATIRETLFDKIKKYSQFPNIINKKNYLEEYIDNAKYFVSQYKNEISYSNLRILSGFIKLHNKPFFIKKLYSIKARSYRYTPVKLRWFPCI